MPLKVTDFRTNRKLMYELLLVTNTNFNTNLAFDMSKIAIFGYPSCV